MKGIVYVLWNPVFNHYGECYKIGCTNDIKTRMKGYTTSYIEACIIKYKTDLREDYKNLEKKIHSVLVDYRVKTKREFFKVSLNIIIETIEELITNNYSVEENIFKKDQKEEYNIEEEQLDFIDIKAETADIDKYIEQIKLSQYNILKVIDRHNLFVNKTLETIQRLSKDSTKDIKIVKIKDPIDEIKVIKESIDNITLFDASVNHKYLNRIISILGLYKKDKISASFKDIFLSIFKLTLEGEDSIDIFSFKLLKEKILKVRDIRWLLLEMEKYPQYFQFTKEDLELMKEQYASRDNIYLVKKFLKNNIQV